jgi:hypothetical protein
MPDWTKQRLTSDLFSKQSSMKYNAGGTERMQVEIQKHHGKEMNESAISGTLPSLLTYGFKFDIIGKLARP